MSEIKVNSIKGVSASTAAITVNNTDGTCTANITNNLSNRNLIINGAMQVAQRGTSSTSSGIATVDRFGLSVSGTDESPTQAQVDVASGTSPYTSGFRKAYKVTNGNQTSGAGTGDRIIVFQNLEAQDIANSGWNYTSSSSFVTLSFWAKSSVAQTFYVALTTDDGTSQRYGAAMTFASTDTWTKFTYKIPGNSNLTFDNNTDRGLQVFWTLFRGTDTTDNSFVLNQWAAYNSSIRYPDITSTWYTTNDATFELTGVQLEVSDYATDFEHRSFSQELALCQRYYEVLVSGSGKTWGGIASMYHANETHHQCNWVEKRATPSLEFEEGTNYYAFYGNSTNVTSNRPTQLLYANTKAGGIQTDSSRLSGSLLGGGAAFSYTNNASAFVAVSADL